MKEHDIVAGSDEKLFTQRYQLNIALPMPETQFITLLDRLGLYYEVCGERGIGMGIPKPNHQPTVDLSRAIKCYKIYGGIDEIHRIGRRYRAFIDGQHQVFYIENVFMYTGP